MGNIYFTSDLHFCHQQEFLWGPRGFDNQYDMNEGIINNWNAVVQPEDNVYVLGDLIMNDNDLGIQCIKQLKGNIHVILGNHDTPARIALYKECYNIVEVVDAKWLKYKKQQFFLSHYPCLTDNHDEGKPLSRRIVSLCGHVHTQDKWHDWDKGLIYHVELDAHQNAPVLIDTIIEDIKSKVQD